MKVYNHSKNIVEEAEVKTCPRCKGFGALSTDGGGPCTLCRGRGRIWMAKSGSGWCRMLWANLESSILY